MRNEEKNSSQKSKANSSQKSKANSSQKSKANSRQKSKANSRQAKSKANSRQEKSIANGRQSKPKDCDRDKAKYEENRTTEEKLQPAMQMTSSNPSSQPASPRCPAGAILAEAFTTIPKIDFDEEIVEYKKIIQTSQKQRFRKSRRS